MEEREEVKRIEAPPKRSLVWLEVTAFIVLLAALAVGMICLGRQKGGSKDPHEAQATSIPTDTPAPTITPEPTAAPTLTPDPTTPPVQSYSRTAIVVDGQKSVVVASREAAEELINNAALYFRDLAGLPDNAVTSLAVKVDFVDAPDDDAVSYDAAFAYLTGDSTPLVFISRASYVEDTPIPHTDRVIPDSYLPKGIRVVKIYGRDGIERKTYSVIYRNGVKQSTSVSDVFVVMEPVDGDIRVGKRVFPQGFTVGPSYGSNPAGAYELGIRVPMHGKVITLYGPYDGGFHHGIDIAAAPGTEVRASARGKVVSVMERGGYGLLIEIEHDNGVTTRYAELKEAFVSIGQRVEAGQTIGTIAGDEFTAHLHFELRIRGTAYNPLKLMTIAGIEG